MKKSIIIIGARGFEYNYGGWETFVTNLVKNDGDENTHYYIPTLTHKKKESGEVLEKGNVTSPKIYVPDQGFVTMFTFTIKATRYYLKYLKKNKLPNPLLYMLGCKVGPLFFFWRHRFHKLNTKIIINPDGLEWTRDKWSWWIKKCFKISERTMIKYSDYCVCDSKAIEEYIKKEYPKYHTPTTFIAYGAYLKEIKKINPMTKKIFAKHHIKPHEYFLIVGRFIPENNYETIIKEFMKTNLKKDLVIVCNVEKNKFYEHLQATTNFEKDHRIKFIGPVYGQEDIETIRFFAFAYIHGHSAGGTNPSLLEALSLTNLNILYDVAYNREVGENACLYFTKEENNLKETLEKTMTLSDKNINNYGKKAKKRIQKEYTWPLVTEKYQTLFNSLINEKNE